MSLYCSYCLLLLGAAGRTMKTQPLTINDRKLFLGNLFALPNFRSLTNKTIDWWPNFLLVSILLSSRARQDAPLWSRIPIKFDIDFLAVDRLTFGMSTGVSETDDPLFTRLDWRGLTFSGKSRSWKSEFYSGGVYTKQLKHKSNLKAYGDTSKHEQLTWLKLMT